MNSIESVLRQDSRPYEALKKPRHIVSSEVSPDTPKMVVRWHYAVDVPKRRIYERSSEPKNKTPANFVAFSERDSKSLENAWSRAGDDAAAAAAARTTKVPVNEDHLFEVDVDERELGPIFWRGPIYEVRRGTWHFAEGGVLKPCDENLATQVEDGYLKVKPFRDASVPAAMEGESPSPNSNKKTIDVGGISSKDKLNDVSKDSRLLATPEAASSKADLARRKSLTDHGLGDTSADVKRPTHREHMRPLFGAYTGKYILYTGKTTAWLLSDDLYGKISSSFLQSVTRGVHMGGQKLKRGYADPEPTKETPLDKADLSSADPIQALGNAMPGSMPDSPSVSRAAKEADAGTGAAPAAQGSMDSAFDINGTDNPDRKIEHLILCCHGIGQKLGERMESVNFVHDVNVLRRNFKATFMHSRDLQTLSAERHNCGVQVLPVEWRQNIQFGMSKDYDGPTAPKAEKDLSNALDEHEDEHATLEDITVEGVQTIRNLVSDVLLDILLYYQPSYREKIVRAVSKEMNRFVCIPLKVSWLIPQGLCFVQGEKSIFRGQSVHPRPLSGLCHRL